MLTLVFALALAASPPPPETGADAAQRDQAALCEGLSQALDQLGVVQQGSVAVRDDSNGYVHASAKLLEDEKATDAQRDVLAVVLNRFMSLHDAAEVIVFKQAEVEGRLHALWAARCVP